MSQQPAAPDATPAGAPDAAQRRSLAEVTPPIALGPLDGRYRDAVAPLVDHLSEAALNRERVHVEVEWLIHLTSHHVVPGAPITRKAALKADGAVLDTALAGATITVDVKKYRWVRKVVLVDADPDDRNPSVRKFDINRGNLQIAHGITAVRRPANL